MTERESQLIESAAVDDDVLSPEAPDDELTPELETASGAEEVSLPLTSPPQPGDFNVSPDGTMLAYLQHDETGALQLWLSSLDGTESRELTTTIDLREDADPPQWSPDGLWIAVTGAHPADGRSAIFVLNVQNGSARLLVDHPGADSYPRWSPDGTMIAFISSRNGRDAVAVGFVDSVGAAVQMTHAHIGQDDHDLCWSSDGQRIAFARRVVENDVAGDHLWTVNIASGETKQITKRLANRKSLSWSPERALVLHIADDGDWENVAVVNADNSAGWNIASEAGDKSDPHYTHDGGRVVYTRLKDGVVRCCERAASSSSAELIDPGTGTVRSPRFLPDKRVAYIYQPATGAARFIVQEPKADAERNELPMNDAWSADRSLITPRHIEVEISGRKIGGLLYQMSELSGPAPAVIYLAERPDGPRVAAFDVMAQALAATGLVVFAPTLPGTPGYGKKVLAALKDQSATESEVNDLLLMRDALKKFEGVDYGRIAVVGKGYGGSLALLLAGSRPGQVQAVVAIDPISDWDQEFDHADEGMRGWMTKNFGIPATSRGIYAVRTPATFVGVIDAPLMVIGTDQAPSGRASQLDELTADMRDLEVDFVHEVSLGESDWEVGAKAAAFLRQFLNAASSPIDDRVDAVMESSAL